MHAVFHKRLVGCLCGTEPISSVAVPVSKYGEGGSWDYSYAWHHTRILRKYLCRRGWGDYWCFLTTSSCCSNCPTKLLWLRTPSVSMHLKAAWLPGLKHLSVCWIALIGQPIGLNTSENNNNNNNNNNGFKNNNDSKGNDNSDKIYGWNYALLTELFNSD